MMEEKKILSIVIPVYNVESYLNECLDSIVNKQTDDIEIIIINDGSTDGSLAICEKYEKNYSNIRVISQINQGLSGARNTGIKNAKGEYILFLDSDDFMKEGTLDSIIADIRKGEKDFFLGRAYQYYADKNSFILCQVDYSAVPYNSPCQFFLDLHKKSEFWFAAWLLVINRKFLLDNNLFFKTGIYHEDELWVPSVFVKAKNMGILNYGFYCYRMDREGSIVASPKIKREFDKLIVVDELSKLMGRDATSTLMIKDRISSLVFGVVMASWRFTDNTEYVKFEQNLSTRLPMLNYGKYRAFFYLCKIMGLKLTSKIIKMVLR